MYAQYLRLHQPVWASNIAVIKAARKLMAEHARRDPALRDRRKSFYKRMLSHHHEAGAFFYRNRF